MPSTRRELLNKQLFKPSTTTPATLSISALITNRPSESRGSCFRGLSPARSVMAVEVFSTTSKWSVTRVPRSYDDAASSGRVQSCVDVLRL